MKSFKSLLPGLMLALVGLFSFAFMNATYAQCGSSAGPNIVEVHGGWMCPVDVTINHTGLGGSITCTGLSSSSFPYHITIPTGATITSVTVNGYTATATPTCHPGGLDYCIGVCAVYTEFELIWDAVPQHLHIN